jgi:type IV secretion system protein TrbL
MHFNALTLTLQNFMAAFSGGYGRLQGAANSLLAILVGIEVVLLGLWTALGGGDHVVGIFKKILQIGAWVWIVRSFPTLAKAFVDSCVQAGLQAGGGGDASLILDPSRLAGYGLDATAPLTQKLGDLGMADLSDLIVFGFGYLAILACFLIMAINVFLAVLEYYLFAALVGIFLPFGLLSPTKFLAEKAVGAVVSASVKLMVLAFVTAVVDPVLSNIHFAGPEITFNELWSVFLTVCALMFFCWKAPQLAASLLGGAPHLGAGDLLQAAGAPIAAGMALHAIGGAAMAGVSATRAAVAGAQSGAGSKSSLASATSPLGVPGGTSERAGGEGSGGSSGSRGGSAGGGGGSAGSTPRGGGLGASASLVQSAMGKSATAPTGASTSSAGPTLRAGGAMAASSTGAVPLPPASSTTALPPRPAAPPPGRA